MPYIPKRYGESKVDKCPFCQQLAFSTNIQGIPVCKNHQHSEMGEVKCICGEVLDMRQGKFGVFFTCMSCGPMNMRKVLEINTIKDVSKHGAITAHRAKQEKTQKTMTVRSDDPRYFE
jgi:hypothetical protein